MAALNYYDDMASLICDYMSQPVGTYLNQSIVINEVTLSCDIYKVSSGTTLTSAIFTGCTANDANTQIIVGVNMSVASGVTLTPPYRCKGIIIGDAGTFTNNGTISMTARGASGVGKNIKLTSDYQISATGGAGGARTTNGTGNSGSTSSTLSCAGGGSGGQNHGGSYSGAGGSGTSFSGGAGGGGSYGSDGGAGSSTGGAGGNGGSHQGGTGDSMGGGAGNPGGTGTGSTAGANGDTGTGGLCVILANKIVQAGTLKSQGSNGGAPGYSSTSIYGHAAGGGGSGGGCIVLLSTARTITGTYNVNGGSGGANTDATTGGAGGTGKYASYIVSDLVLINLEVQFAITDLAHIDNINPSDTVRFIGVTDKNKLCYEIMGERHSVDSGHAIEDEETTYPDRSNLQFQTPLLVEDDDTEGEEKIIIGADTSGSLDFTQIIAPGTAGQVEGHIYSTDEHVVGTWIDSKPIYEKTLIISNTGFSAGNKSIVIDSDTSHILLNYEGFFTRSGQSDIWVLPFINHTTAEATRVYESHRLQFLSTGIGLQIISSYSSSVTDTYTITYRYTKTTDTV